MIEHALTSYEFVIVWQDAVLLTLRQEGHTAHARLNLSALLPPLSPVPEAVPGTVSEDAHEEASAPTAVHAQAAPSPIVEIAPEPAAQEPKEPGEAAPFTPARVRPRLPPVGQRTIDYVLRVLDAAGGRLPFAQVVTCMQALGWTTDSTEPQAIASNIRSACNKYKGLVQVEGDALLLTDAGRALLRETRAKQDAATPEAA